MYESYIFLWLHVIITAIFTSKFVLRVPDMIVPQSQQNEKPQGLLQKFARLPLLRIIFFIFALISLAMGAVIAIINFNLDQQHQTIASLAWTKPVSVILLSIVTPILTILVAFLQWLFPISSSQSTTTPATVVVQPPQSQVQATFHNIITVPALNDTEVVQYRGAVVDEVYAMLTRAALSTQVVVLTGISGAGKSVIASSVYYQAENQRNNNTSPFTGETLWLQITPGTTTFDIIGTLFKAFGAVLPEEFSQFMPRYQAALLFNLLNAAGNSRFIILDQFDLLLDNHTGQMLPENQGIGEWLCLLNSRASSCRLLLTSRLWPNSIYIRKYMNEYTLEGFNNAEGITFLQNCNIQGATEDLREIVKQCDGNVFALKELVSILQRHKLNISAFLSDPVFVQSWVADIMRESLEAIVNLLNPLQNKLLLAFSIYRQPVPLKAIESPGQLSLEVPASSVLSALDGLLVQNVMRVTHDGKYYVYAVIAEYMRNNFANQHGQTTAQLVRSAHARAAKYYLQQTCLPGGQRKQVKDIEPLLEAYWHFCQADLWQEAYNLALQEDIFSSLKDWGEYYPVLELYRLMLSSEQWSQKYFYVATIWQDMSNIYNALGRTEDAHKYLEKANALRSNGNNA